MFYEDDVLVEPEGRVRSALDAWRAAGRTFLPAAHISCSVKGV